MEREAPFFFSIADRSRSDLNLDFGAYWGAPGHLLGLLGGILGASWGRLGASLGRLGGVLRPWGVSGAS